MATSEERLRQYEDLFNKSQQYDPNKFKQEFEKAYGEATGYNQDLITQQSQALGELQGVAPTLRERYSNTLITDPTRQMALIAQARQAPITQWGTAAGLLNQRGQRYEDILANALGGYQTAAQQAQTAAENAWRLYQDALQQDQFNRQLAASRGGGGGALDLNSLLSARQPQQESPLDITVETEPEKLTWTQRLTRDTGKPIQSSPLMTVAGLVGNLIGNRSRSDMSFIDKLFNRR